jgi:Glycosyltransferase sugar-binding region containing DXD motif
MPPVAPQAEEDPTDHVIQGLWIGDALSIMERLSIASFLANGHAFHLFVYSDVKDVPAGTVVRDANEILPASSIFRYRDNGSYAGFSNFFRYELLWKCGGWWVDLDTICLRPFRFAGDYVIGSELYAGGTHPISGVLKAPPRSPLMRYLTEVCRGKDVETLKWGETGPKLVADGIARFSLEEYVQPTETFCPLAWHRWEEVLKPSASIALEPPVRAIHLWNDLWRRHGKDKGAAYHPDCLYEKLKTRYL